MALAVFFLLLVACVLPDAEMGSLSALLVSALFADLSISVRMNLAPLLSVRLSEVGIGQGVAECAVKCRDLFFARNERLWFWDVAFWQGKARLKLLYTLLRTTLCLFGPFPRVGVRLSHSRKGCFSDDPIQLISKFFKLAAVLLCLSQFLV